MATNCDICSLRTNEVKSGGGVEPLGQRIVVRLDGKEEFSRDVLKVNEFLKLLAVICKFQKWCIPSNPLVTECARVYEQ